jgi:DNA-binding IclR family transcriptional regulator
MRKAKARDHTVKVQVKGFEILETLSQTGENGVRLTDVATVRKLPAPTVFRILRTLVKIGYVAFNERSERYCIAEPLKSRAPHADRHRGAKERRNRI